MNTHNIIHNIAFGTTGSGKSHFVNCLTHSNETRPKVVEGNSLSPVTNQITERKMYNGEIITDTIGFLNRPSESVHKDDQEILKEFVDYLKGKTIRTILYIVIAPRINQIDENALHSLKLSGLQDHIIIVINRCVGQQGNQIGKFDGIRTISIETNQSDLMILKNMIRDTPTKLLRNIVVPPILFKNPIVVKAKNEVREFLREESISIKELLFNEVRIPYTVEVTWSTNIFAIVLEFLFGIRNTTTETRYRTETATQEVMVKRSHRVFQVYAVELAERFDGALDIYKKNPIAIDLQRIG
eukprot:gene4044-4422_t